MTIRITGMNSGLDTEAIINELASARSVKVQKIEKNQTKLSWKIDAWKELNTKIYSLYSDILSDLRFDYAYKKKTTKVSDEDAVTVITGGDAMDGVQSLKINQIAKSGYLTGGKIDASSSEKLLANMPGLDWLKDSNQSVSFKVRVGGEDKHISLNGYNTLNDVVEKFKEVGLNAKFDMASKRFFISSKETGEAADFSMSHAELQKVPEFKKPIVKPGETVTDEMLAEIEKANAERDKIIAANNKIIEANKDLGLQVVPDEQKIEFSDSAETIAQKNEMNARRQKIIDANNKIIDEDKDKKISGFNEKSKNDFANTLKALGLMTEKMASDGGYNVTFSEEEKKAGKVANKIDGVDSRIELNGVMFTSKTNTFEINGLTMTVHKETDEVINLTTEQDTSGIYDTIKNFIKKYSELINEMDKLYNAESASKYEPLTKEEKEALSDTEVEEWEKKIKESLLRRDSTLSSVSSAMKEVMLSTSLPGGKNEKGEDITITLAYFGIETLGYFKAKDNEKNAYHINGDPDDKDVKSYEDKLKKAIATEPDTVVEFFKKLANNLYDTLEDKMAKTDYSSRYTVYNDVQMAAELKEYDSKIATEQKKLNDYIDRWYEKFSQMEVALGKLNSQQSSISSLFG